MSDAATPPKAKSFESEVRSAQEQALRDNSDVFLLGENVGKMGGIRGASTGFLERFGPDRVVDTTISDSATLGMASGMALAGKKVIVELSGPDRLAATWEVLRLDLANLPRSCETTAQNAKDKHEVVTIDGDVVTLRQATP